MTVTQIVEIPENRRLSIEVPRGVPTGSVILSFTPASKPIESHNCPICAQNTDPVTGNPRYNQETIAAIEEGMAISRGEIPAKRFNSLSEMLDDLERDDPDE